MITWTAEYKEAKRIQQLEIKVTNRWNQRVLTLAWDAFGNVVMEAHFSR
jgi:hypothetical protein